MPGQTDLASMVAALTVTRRPMTYTFVRVDPDVALGDGVDALIAEAEGITAVMTTERARADGRHIDFEATWLTLDVHSALEAVGLTAAVSGALAGAGIACNVLAGIAHDHLLVPADRADDAIAHLEALRS